MTERLYYEDPYLLEFDAVVEKCEKMENGSRVWLNRSAFYPTSGGQPCDMGTIGEHPVVSVEVEQGDVVHTVLGAPTQGEQVHCRIDASRRRDHMQQHCGEHMLAYTVYKRYGGYTHGLHIGEEFSSIDVTMPDGSTHLPAEDLISMEEEINSWIMENRPVRSWFPSDAELAGLPLRKESSVKEHIRIVHIAPDEYIACGGTHPFATGEVGCIRILEARPSRGKVRVSFLCGLRAVRDNRSKTDLCLQAAASLSVAWQDLPEAVARLQQQNGLLSAQLRQERKKQAVERISVLLDRAPELGDGSRLVCAEFEGLDAEALREAAGYAVHQGRVYALTASLQEGKPALLAFARGEGCACEMGSLLSQTAKAFGGKGGGKPDFAQGSALDGEGALLYAAEKLREAAL